MKARKMGEPSEELFITNSIYIELELDLIL
jgi:hypothetical protein